MKRGDTIYWRTDYNARMWGTVVKVDEGGDLQVRDYGNGRKRWIGKGQVVDESWRPGDDYR